MALKLTANQDGKVSGTNVVAGHEFSARLDLLIIQSAYHAGISFEDIADGFGAGQGTHGDWSGIRDSSEPATMKMLERALNAMTFTPPPPKEVTVRFEFTLSERQIACLRSASLGYATRAKYQALPEAEQRALLDLINEPCSDHPWLTPQGKAALSQVKS